MMNLEQYKGMADRMKDFDDGDSNSHPGSNSAHDRDRDGGGGGGLDGRATLVPPAGGIPTLNMLQVRTVLSISLCDPDRIVVKLVLYLLDDLALRGRRFVDLQLEYDSNLRGFMSLAKKVFVYKIHKFMPSTVTI